MKLTSYRSPQDRIGVDDYKDKCWVLDSMKLNSLHTVDVIVTKFQRVINLVIQREWNLFSSGMYSMKINIFSKRQASRTVTTPGKELRRCISKIITFWIKIPSGTTLTFILSRSIKLVSADSLGWFVWITHSSRTFWCFTEKETISDRFEQTRAFWKLFS